MTAPIVFHRTRMHQHSFFEVPSDSIKPLEALLGRQEGELWERVAEGVKR